MALGWAGDSPLFFGAGNILLKEETIKKIEELADQVASREGCVLYDIEFLSLGQGRTLRVTIDREGGIGVEDCARVSRGLNLLLDVEDTIPGGNYHLEVSSPGLDRRLKKQWHFEKAVGQKIWLKLDQSIEQLGIEAQEVNKNSKQLNGFIEAVVEGKVEIRFEVEKIKIPLKAIEKAKLVFDFKETKKPKKKLN
jgi:ribosome maturation factor RimP